MTLRVDPENNEPRALFEMSDFTDKHVLEIGCGNGNKFSTHVTCNQLKGHFAFVKKEI